jgi:putative Holliday junction resolvase
MRIMAIDYGDARTGVAISDPTGLLAGQTFVIREWNMDGVVRELMALAAQNSVEELVLGYPKNMNDTLGPRAEKSKVLAEALREKTGLPVILWDERRTTVDAHRILSETGNRGKKRKEKVDAVAATLILEGYLTYRRMQG